MFLLQTLLSEFNKEQEAFIKAKGGKGGEALPPWVGYPDEEGLKEEILALSTVSTRSCSSPKESEGHCFDKHQMGSVGVECEWNDAESVYQLLLVHRRRGKGIEHPCRRGEVWRGRELRNR